MVCISIQRAEKAPRILQNLRMGVEAWGIWCPMKNHNGGKGCEAKLLERDTSYLRIECSTLTISAALMWKWHLNSNFMACSPFYHLQQSFDGTSILRNALRHTGEEVGCKEEGYKRKRASQKQRGDFDFL